MIMKILFIFICFVTVFCHIKAEDNYVTKKQAIKWLREEQSTDTTQAILGYDIIQKIGKNKIGYISIFKLAIYFPKEKQYKSMSYYLHVADIMEEKKTLPKYDYEQVVKMDKSVTKAYKKHPLGKFIAIYCEKSSSGGYLMKPGLSYKTTWTVLYYLYQNDYFFCFNEYGGYYSFERISLPIVLKDKKIIIKEEHDVIRLIED